MWRRHIVVWGLVVGLLTSAVGATEDRVWAKARAKMLGDAGYSMVYLYDGPEGSFRFRYLVEGDGERILTEVLEGSARGVGTRILYDPAKDPANVSLATKMVTLRRSLKARDIEGSSLYQPLFRQLVEELVEPEPREILRVGEHSLLLFGDKAGIQDRLEVDSQGNPVAHRRLERGKEVKSMQFRELSWGAAAIVWP